MTETKGIDIAWDRPTISQILATGAKFAARYFSPDATKNLTAAEVRDYPAAGIAIVTVWEGTATRARDGYAAGQADAHAAERQRAAVGLPSDTILHFAVDFDTDWASVAPYFAGVASVIGRARTGVYGGLKVIEGAAAAGYRWLWQTDAWSGGVWSPHATIRQEGGTCLAGQADYDTAEVADFGQYPRPEVYVATLDPQDKADIIDGVLRGIQGGPTRDAIAFAELWWLDHALGGTTTASMTPGQAGLIRDIHRLITELNATTPPPKAPGAPTAAAAPASAVPAAPAAVAPVPQPVATPVKP